MALPPILSYHKVDPRFELGVTRLGPRVFSRQVRAFKERYRVIAPDLRGFGHSTDTDGEIVSMEQYAADLKACRCLDHRAGTGPLRHGTVG